MQLRGLGVTSPERGAAFGGRHTPRRSSPRLKRGPLGVVTRCKAVECKRCIGGILIVLLLAGCCARHTDLGDPVDIQELLASLVSRIDLFFARHKCRNYTRTSFREGFIHVRSDDAFASLSTTSHRCGLRWPGNPRTEDRNPSYRLRRTSHLAVAETWTFCMTGSGGRQPNVRLISGL